MSIFLFTWNPKKWQWEDLPGKADQVTAGEVVLEDASSSTSQAVPGDRFFILRSGLEPKGIYASGYIQRGPYEGLHWDEEKRKQGITQRKYELKFDKLLVPEKDSILGLDLLQTEIPLPHNWTPQSSGIMIPDDAAEKLEKLWASHHHRKFHILPESQWPTYCSSSTHKEHALKFLPYLVYLAKLGETISYGEAAEYLNIHHRVMGFPLAFIRDCICIPNDLPLLTVLIVSKADSLPGDGFLLEGRQHLSDEEYREKVNDFFQQTILYQGWDQLLRDLNLNHFEVSDPETHLDQLGKKYSQALKRQAARTGGGEGEPHLHLKEYIADHPEVIGLPEDSTAIVEYAFISGDEADVVLQLPDGTYHIAEIKNGPSEGELVKGIYQLVKYGALLWAEKHHQNNGRVSGTLVAYEIPLSVTKFACSFLVQCHVIAQDTVAKYRSNNN